MQLEDYFEFETLDTPHGPVERIRFQGSRVDIGFVIEDYLQGALPEQIASNYRRSVNLEQVFAALTYYFHNRQKMEEYLRRGAEVAEAYYQDYLKQEPAPVVERLLALQEQRQEGRQGTP